MIVLEEISLFGIYRMKTMVSSEFSSAAEQITSILAIMLHDITILSTTHSFHSNALELRMICLFVSQFVSS